MANKINANFVGSGLLILTENVNGEMYQIFAENFQDVLDNWEGECDFVPCNGAKVFFAAYKGRAIDPNEYTDFGSLIRYLEISENEDRPLMLRLLEAGYPRTEMYHHESDLYVFVTSVTTEVIKNWCRERGYSRAWHCPIFRDQVSGKPMYDCAFQYFDWKGGKSR